MYEKVYGEKMKDFLAMFWTVLGVILGLYLGVWCCFIMGIIDILIGLMNPVNILGIAFGILKIMCSGLVGWSTFLICAFISSTYITNAPE